MMVTRSRKWSVKQIPSQMQEDSDSGSDVERNSFAGVEIDHHRELLQKASLTFDDFEDDDDDGSQDVDVYDGHNEGDDQRGQRPIDRAMPKSQAKAGTEDGRRREEVETSPGLAPGQRGEAVASVASGSTLVRAEQAVQSREKEGSPLRPRPEKNTRQDDALGDSELHVPEQIDPQTNEWTGDSISRLNTGESSAATNEEYRPEQSEAKGPKEAPPQRSRQGRLDLMIAAVTAMVVMSIPERFYGMLWMLCSATVVLVAVQRWGLPEGLARDCAASTEGREVRDGKADADFDAAPDAAPIFEQRQQHQSGSVRKKAPEPKDEDLSDRVIEASRVVDDRGGDVAVQAEHEAEGLGVAAVSEDGGQERGLKTDEDLLSKIQAGLSATQLAFLNSAGEEPKNRILHQCLKYANGDVAQARKVCIKLCEFRLAEGWDLMISASELQAPLRSRVHTLTDGRDRSGRAMITFSPGALDLAKAPIVAYHKMLCYVLQEILKEDEVPEKGIVLLVDARGVGIGMLKNLKVSDYKRGLRMLSGAFPVKVKAIRILHLTRGLSMALYTVSALMSAKMRSRLEIVPDDQAADGSFARNLADLSRVPIELAMGGTWTGSQNFWNKWVFDRVSRP